jgi:polyhydroxyalkanoate synthesis regulator phasin
MAMKQARKTGRSTKAKSTPRPAPAGARLREAWQELAATVATAQANLESGVKQLLRRNKISTKDGASLLADVRALAERERKKAAKELRSRLRDLQQRVEKERKGAVRGLDDAVHSALAALNIPSRAEVAALTRKVDELSRRIGRLKR